MTLRTSCRVRASLILTSTRPSCFCFHDPSTTEIYTLSLHDALPISGTGGTARLPTSRRHPAKKENRTSQGVSEKSDRKSTRLNSSHVRISYAVFCLTKKNVRQRDAPAPVAQPDPRMRAPPGRRSARL